MLGHGYRADVRARLMAGSVRLTGHLAGTEAADQVTPTGYVTEW